VKKGSDYSGNAYVWDMADFFIVRGVRGKGVGSRVAEKIWRQFPGPWEIRVLTNNLPARKFWASAVSTFVGTLTQAHLVVNGNETRYLFQFESNANEMDDPQ
jgi:predicted acetyltransferase